MGMLLALAFSPKADAQANKIIGRTNQSYLRPYFLRRLAFFLAWQNNNAGRKSLVSSLYCVLTNMTIRFSSRGLLGLGLTLLLLGMAQAQEASEVSRWRCC